MSDQQQVPGEEHKQLYENQIDFEERKHHLLQCPNCDHFINADEINIDKTIAKCSNCNHVFDFSHEFEGLHFDRGRPDMLIPNGLEVLKLRSELDIRINWFKASNKAGMMFSVVFGLIWNLMLLPFIITAIMSGQLYILLFTAAHIAVGVTFLYHIASMFLNTTSVNVTKRKLEIKTWPLRSPIKRNKSYETSEIDQLYVTKYVSSKTNGQPNYAYALYAVMKNAERVQLFKGMNKETQLYLEQEIEKFLKIKDKRVSGAISK